MYSSNRVMIGAGVCEGNGTCSLYLELSRTTIAKMETCMERFKAKRSVIDCNIFARQDMYTVHWAANHLCGNDECPGPSRLGTCPNFRWLKTPRTRIRLGSSQNNYRPYLAVVFRPGFWLDQTSPCSAPIWGEVPAKCHAQCFLWIGWILSGRPKIQKKKKKWSSSISEVQ